MTGTRRTDRGRGIHWATSCASFGSRRQARPNGALVFLGFGVPPRGRRDQREPPAASWCAPWCAPWCAELPRDHRAARPRARASRARRRPAAGAGVSRVSPPPPRARPRVMDYTAQEAPRTASAVRRAAPIGAGPDSFRRGHTSGAMCGTVVQRGPGPPTRTSSCSPRGLRGASAGGPSSRERGEGACAALGSPRPGALAAVHPAPCGDDDRAVLIASSCYRRRARMAVTTPRAATRAFCAARPRHRQRDARRCSIEGIEGAQHIERGARRRRHRAPQRAVRGPCAGDGGEHRAHRLYPMPRASARTLERGETRVARPPARRCGSVDRCRAATCL
jgi:hypothetical protein